MNALLNYPGAKWGMAEEIVSLMPPHRSYLEPYFGSGAVLFNKPPSAIETVNDVDGDVVNFFTVLREKPEKLAQRIELTPYARDIFDDACNNWGMDLLDQQSLWYWPYIGSGEYALWSDGSEIYGLLKDRNQREIQPAEWMLPIKMSEYYAAVERFQDS